MEELDKIVQRMIDAGESEENIKIVIENYKPEETVETEPAKKLDPADVDPAVESKNDTGSISTDGSLESQYINSFNKAKFSQAQLDEFSLLMEEVVKGVENVPKREKTTTEKIVGPILDVGFRFMAAGFNIPTQLESAWEGTKAAAIDWVSTVAGGDAADFLTGEKDFGKAIAFIDPLTDSEITFNSDPERWKELNTLNSKQGVDIKSTYSGTETEIGTSAENYIIDTFRNIKKLNEEILETGSIVKGFKEGDIPEILGGIFNAVGSLVSTAAPAALTRGASLFPQVAAPMYVDFNVTKAETLYPDSEDPISELVKKGETQMDVPLALGVVATGLEYIGLKGISKQIAGATGKLSPLVSLALTQNKEGLTEVFQLGTEKINTSIAAGKSVTDAVVDGLKVMASEDGLESYAQGVIGSGIVSAPSAINKAINGEKQSVSFINKTINNIVALQSQRSLNKNKSFREAIDIEIRELETSLKNHFIENNNISRSFDENQRKEIISLVEDKDENQLRLEELKKSFDFNNLTARQYGTAKSIITKNNAKISNRISEIKNSVDLSTLDTQIKTVEKLASNIEGISVKSLDNAEAVDSFIAENKLDIDKKASGEQGFIYQNPDTGEQTIVINKEVAAKEQAVNVAAHEFLHGLLFQTVKNSPETQISLGKSLNEYINKIDTTQVKDSDFAKRLESYKDMDAATQSEEVLTLFSDAIATGDIQFNESVFTKIGDVIRRTLQNLGVSIKFNNGKDVYNFVKDYNKSIEKGKLTKAQKAVGKKGAEGALVLGKTEENTTNVKESKSTNATPLEAINALVPNTVKTQAEYFSPRVFNPIYNALEDNGVISNYIKSKSPSKEVASKTIESIRERLINFDPEATRKNKGNAEPITFGEFIFANTNFGKLDAKKALFKESQEDSNKIDIDSEQAKGVAVVESSTEKAEAPEYRKIIDSNVLFKDVVSNVKTKVLRTVRTLKSRLDANVSKNKTVTPIIAEIKKEMGKQADIDLKKAIGGKANGQMERFLIKNKKAILENMTTTWLTKAMPSAVQKMVGGNWTSDWSGKKIDRESTKTDNAGRTSGAEMIRRKPNVANMPDAEFLSYFLDSKGDPIRGRKESLAKAMAEEISLEIFNRELQDENSEISKAFENNQQLKGVVLAESYTAEVSKQSERGNVKFSKKKLQDMFYLSIEGDAAAVDTLYATLDEESKAIWEKVGTQLNGGSEGYKKGLKTWESAPNAVKGILADYFKNISKKEDKISMKQLDVFSNKLIDALPNSLVKALGADFFGAHYRYLNTKEGTKGGDIKNKINSLKEDGIDLGFDPNDITMVQAGFGLVDKITKDVLNKEFNTVQDKIDYFNENYKDEVDALNIANKQAAQTVLLSAFDIIVKDPSQAVGFLRLLESTTNIGKSLRGLTGISDIQFYAESQAVYLNKNTGATYTNTLTKSQQKLVEEGVIIINENHPNYKDAVKAIKDGSKQPLADLLRIKGEHATPDAKKKLEIAKILLDQVAIAIENPTQVKIIRNAFAAKLNVELQNFNQQLNTKVLSDIQDSKLGATSSIGDARLLVIPKESLLAFYDMEGLQTANRVKRAFDDMFTAEKIQKLASVETQQKAINNATSIKWSKSPKKIRVFDFDDTLGRTKSNVLYTMPDGATGKIDAATFAKEVSNMEAEGAQWDFSEFSKVMDGKPGPLLEVAKIIADKRGTDDLFVLTARPQDAAGPIQEFLSGLGLDIPLKNITGLGDGSPKAKADWMIGKVAEGYNDFYFADDHTGNVKAVKDVLDTFDVKGKVQLAKVKFSKSLDSEFNLMIERNKGVGASKEFSKVVAKRRGAKKGKYKAFITSSADDFRGLTSYTFAGKGKQGEADQAFFEDALLTPYFRGVNALESARVAIKNDFKQLGKIFKPEVKKLGELTPDGDFTYDQALRVYMWTKQGVEIPGISKRDQAKLVKLIAGDTGLQAFSEAAVLATKKESWPEPGEYWDVKTMLSDLNDLTEISNRAEYIAEFIENADIIFSEKNLNKIEAVYGTKHREALEDALYAMKNGTNRSFGSNKITNKWNNWVNNSIGTIMFFNRRSALMQTLSITNFLNWSDNNPINAGLAFANQPQYWKDFVMIFNSDKLKQRRGGLKADVQEAEIANAAKGAKNKAQAVISYLLKKGFLPTQIADSFAISMGGASMYRNRVNTYKKQGLDQKAAEEKAFLDFSKISDETQQSGDPALVSQQQRSVAGRLILAFQNTTMQYTRLMKKSAQDLINGRGDAKTHISKIVYYGAVQNFIFNALSNSLFTLIPGFGDEDEEEIDGKELDKKSTRILHGMFDSVTKGTGIYGAVVVTLKNAYRAYDKETEKGYMGQSGWQTASEMLNIAPAIGSKFKKVKSAIDILDKYDKDIIEKHPWDVAIGGRFNPSSTYTVIGNFSSAILNIPLDRALAEARGISEMLDDRNTVFQRVALGLGWRTWDVGAKNEEFDLIKSEAKKKKKKKKDKSTKNKRINKYIVRAK